MNATGCVQPVSLANQQLTASKQTNKPESCVLLMISRMRQNWVTQSDNTLDTGGMWRCLSLLQSMLRQTFDERAAMIQHQKDPNCNMLTLEKIEHYIH